MPSLEAPGDSSLLYGARTPDVDSLRPVMQGDIFDNVDIPGIEFGLGLAAVLTHACTMRTAGGALRPILLVARVVNYQHLPPGEWPNGHFRVQPLPNLRSENVDESVAIDFELLGTVASAVTNVDRRVAYLSDYGVTVLQQRFVHHLSRVVVELPILHAEAAPNFEEASLLHEWLEAFVADPSVVDEVAIQTREFNSYLDANEKELRLLLHEAVTRAEVRRRVRREIRLRTA